MRFADLETGVLYSDKNGSSRMVVLDTENLYDTPRFSSYVSNTGRQVMVLQHASSFDSQHRPDLVEAAKEVVIPEGRYKYSDIQWPKGTQVKFVSLALIAGTYADVQKKREAQVLHNAQVHRDAEAARQARRERADNVAESIKEMTDQKYLNFYPTDTGTVTISLSLLELLVAKAQAAEASK